jgi:hypothetical protein
VAERERRALAGAAVVGRVVDLSLLADLLGALTHLGVLPPLDLARTVVLAQVQQAGAVLPDEFAPSRARSPPRASRRSRTAGVWCRRTGKAR